MVHRVDRRGFPPAEGGGSHEHTMNELKGRVAVVTGGASGIGRAMAELFARERAKVVVADVDERALAEVVESIRARDGVALGVRTDVTDLASVEALAATVFRTFGKVNVLCNNAGVALWGGLESATHRDWQWVLGVNLWGVIHGVEAFVPRMVASKEPGHIVNTASMAGLVATRGLGVYNTSKYAVVGLSETLAKDLRPYRIGVSVLCPMGVATQIRESARNRPAGLANAAPSAAEPVELMGRTLAPAAVADMVLAAIRVNRLYVITHEEGLQALRRRHERLEQAVLETKA
jgi:NAD(P)-dependent dehydrogenase (short-subunit alcohol dehydrogenase family)